MVNIHQVQGTGGPYRKGEHKGGHLSTGTLDAAGIGLEELSLEASQQ